MAYPYNIPMLLMQQSRVAIPGIGIAPMTANPPGGGGPPPPRGPAPPVLDPGAPRPIVNPIQLPGPPNPPGGGHIPQPQPTFNPITDTITGGGKWLQGPGGLRGLLDRGAVASRASLPAVLNQGM